MAGRTLQRSVYDDLELKTLERGVPVLPIWRPRWDGGAD